MKNNKKNTFFSLKFLHCKNESINRNSNENRFWKFTAKFYKRMREINDRCLDRNYQNGLVHNEVVAFES